MRLRNDILWKGLLEEIFPDFLRFYFPALYAIVDFDKGYEFLDKELQQLFPEKENILHPRFVDKLVKVFTLSGEEKWILVHIEVQGYEDVNFPSRMFTYFYRILDKYQVPVTALAIYTDTNPGYCPNEYQYSYMGTEAAYRFNTYKVLLQSEETLNQNDNPFAIAVLTVLLALKSGKLDDGNLLSLKVDLVRKLIQKNLSKERSRALFNFIRMYVRFSQPAFDRKFEEEIHLITPNNQSMGLEELILQVVNEEGKSEGKLEGKLEGKMETEREKNHLFVSNLILQSDFDDDKIANLANVSVSFVREIRLQLKVK